MYLRMYVRRNCHPGTFVIVDFCGILLIKCDQFRVTLMSFRPFGDKNVAFVFVFVLLVEKQSLTASLIFRKQQRRN